MSTTSQCKQIIQRDFRTMQSLAKASRVVLSLGTCLQILWAAMARSRLKITISIYNHLQISSGWWFELYSKKPSRVDGRAGNWSSTLLMSLAWKACFKLQRLIFKPKSFGRRCTVMTILTHLTCRKLSLPCHYVSMSVTIRLQSNCPNCLRACPKGQIKVPLYSTKICILFCI